MPYCWQDEMELLNAGAGEEHKTGILALLAKQFWRQNPEAIFDPFSHFSLDSSGLQALSKASESF